MLLFVHAQSQTNTINTLICSSQSRIMSLRFLFLALILSLYAFAVNTDTTATTRSTTSPGNDSPIIGILTLSCADYPDNCPYPNTQTYFASRYVKWLESGGARVVPLFADDSFENIRELLSQLNGVLFTGGTAYLQDGNIWWEQFKNIMSYLVEFHHDNPTQSIPVWGTCLGFQALVVWASGNDDILVSKRASMVSLPLYFTSPLMQNESVMFGINDIDEALRSTVYTNLATKNLTYNHHNSGVSEDVFDKYPTLGGNLSVMANSYDEKGTTFVALVESHASTGLHWYGVQFHPEEVAFVFFPKRNINHDFDTVMANAYFSHFFVNECRIRNSNVMDEEVYNTSVIYNYDPDFVNNGEYVQMYFFPEPNTKAEEGDTTCVSATVTVLSAVGSFLVGLICCIPIVYVFHKQKRASVAYDYQIQD
eukprot:211649_1